VLTESAARWVLILHTALGVAAVGAVQGGLPALPSYR